ncbi:MAG: hypothetical protein M3468_04550 [Acidobacteriota bacterium]|nr:hypothetical protein [Acidobacteriota bacterium]
MSGRLSTGEAVLFQLTRWLALALIIVLLIGIAASSFFYLRPGSENVVVTFADVERVLEPEPAGSEPATAAWPENVKRVLGGNEKILEGWLDVLRAEERPQFLAMMATVITEAEAKKAPNVIAVVNKYKELYFDRRGSTAFAPYAEAAKRAVLISQILLMAGLVGMFILILVLLAIERHLRGGTSPLPTALQQDPPPA